MRKLWVPPVSLSPVSIPRAGPFGTTIKGKLSVNVDSVRPSQRHYVLQIQTAAKLRSPYQTLPTPNTSTYLYSWILPKPSILEDIVNIGPGCFQNTDQAIGLLVSQPLSKPDYVCRIPLYLHRGMVRTRVLLVSKCPTLSDDQINRISKTHSVLCELLFELVTRQLTSVSEVDGKTPFVDRFVFQPDRAHFVGFLTIIKFVAGGAEIDFEAIGNILEWHQAKNARENGISSPLTSRLPVAGIVPTYRCRLSDVPQNCRSGLLVRCSTQADYDLGLHAVHSERASSVSDDPGSVNCFRLTRHLNSCTVVSGLLPDDKSRSIPQPTVYPSASCILHPLSTWLWFMISLVSPILHQLNRALLSLELHQLLELSLYSTLAPRPDKSLTVLLPDRLDAPAGMLRKLRHCSQRDREVNTASVLDQQVEYTISGGIYRVPPASNLLEATTLLGATEAVNLERLEILGDSFLNLIATLHVYHRYSTEGDLTRARSAVISNSNLCALMLRHKWFPYCTSRMFLAADHLLPPCFYLQESAIKANSPHLYIEFTEKSLADVAEALIGCFLFHTGLTAACDLLKFLEIPLDSTTWSSLFEDENSLTDLFDRMTLGRSARTFHNGDVLPDESDSLQTKLGYNFKNVSLLKAALTHHSCSQSDSYERLEFLGDAVLGYIVTRYLYNSNPEYDPGRLTAHRSKIVNNMTLAYALIKGRMHPYILHKVPSFPSLAKELISVGDNPDSTLNELVNHLENSKSIRSTKIFGDILEALIGAVFVDSRGDLRITSEVIYRLLGDILTRPCF